MDDVIIENRGQETVDVEQGGAGVGRCLFREAAVQEAVDRRLGSCIVPDYEELGLPFVKEEGRSGFYGDYGLELSRSVSSHASAYKVGDVIKVIGNTDGTSRYALSVNQQGLTAAERLGRVIISGVSSAQIWVNSRYYRVTGIYECKNQAGTEVLYHVFTYTQLTVNEDRTVTDLAGEAIEIIKEYVSSKVDSAVETIINSLPGEASEEEINTMFE